MICPNCQKNNSDNSIFCAGCGAKLHAASQQNQQNAQRPQNSLNRQQAPNYPQMPPVQQRQQAPKRQQAPNQQPPYQQPSYQQPQYQQQPPKAPKKGKNGTLITVVVVLLLLIVALVGALLYFFIFKDDEKEKTGENNITTTTEADYGNVTIDTTGIYTGNETYIPVTTAEPTETETETEEPTPEETMEATEDPYWTVPDTSIIRRIGVRLDSDGYLFPDSSSRYLTSSDVYGMTNDQIQYAINEIYARNGYVFSKDDWREHFEALWWYTPSASFNFAEMNQYEQANITFLMDSKS